MSSVNAALSPDPTGMWYDPANPGWGLSVTQQGGNIFAVLFVYDANHQPEWFVASNVVPAGDLTCVLVGVASCAASQPYSGTLYRTTGASFASSADTTTVQAVPAGTLSLFLTVSDRSQLQIGAGLSASYIIDGTFATKVLQRQTWGSLDLTGTYKGGLGQVSVSGNCTSLQSDAFTTPTDLVATQDGTQLDIRWGAGAATCAATGTLVRLGQIANYSGQLQCAGDPSGTFTISNMAIGPLGFAGSAFYNDAKGCAFSSTIGGLKTQ